MLTLMYYLFIVYFILHAIFFKVSKSLFSKSKFLVLTFLFLILYFKYTFFYKLIVLQSLIKWLKYISKLILLDYTHDIDAPIFLP